jgi:nucleotide-binding universal stress UspA family protein
MNTKQNSSQPHPQHEDSNRSAGHSDAIALRLRRILVTTDLAEISNYLIPRAYSILEREGVLCLTTVVHPHQLPRGEYLQGPADSAFRTAHAEYILACEAQLRALVPHSALSESNRTSIEITEHSDAAEGICLAAERFNADVICVSTHGRSGLSKALLGSVAQKLLTITKRPVLVFPIQHG